MRLRGRENHLAPGRTKKKKEEEFIEFIYDAISDDETAVMGNPPTKLYRHLTII